MNASELSAHERALIDFEREWWQLGSRKDVGIRARFDMSASSYYRALHALVDRAEAMRVRPADGACACASGASRPDATASKAGAPIPAPGDAAAGRRPGRMVT